MADPAGSMKVIALMQARGRGSTLPGKNIYPLLGKPMLWHFLNEIKKADFIDEIGVWTESDAIAKVVYECGGRVLHRPKEMVYYGSGFHTPEQWDRCIESQIEEMTGGKDHIRVWLNCNHVLLSASTLVRMYEKLIRDPQADIIFPIYEIEGDICMVNPKTRYLFPVFAEPMSPRCHRAPLYRKVGVHISYAHPRKPAFGMRTLYHLIPWYEGKDVQEIDDIPFAEFMLEKRGGDRR